MDIIKNFFYPNKNDILDPLSLVIKLYIYSYKPTKTKVSILNNKIEFQEDGIFQSTVRTLNRDTKNDLINMLLPLTFACETYLHNNTDRDKYVKIFEEVVDSLDKLNKVYESNEITQNIEQLKNIILKSINEKDFNSISIVSNWNEPASVLKKSFYAQTNSVWTSNRLEILFGYINEISNSNSDENTNVLIISLNTFMNYIDILVSKYISNLHLLR
jgi:hypothetical protein